jgi:hypothetical protein
MKLKLLTALLLLAYTTSRGQITLKTEYLGSAKYKQNANTNLEEGNGTHKGSTMIYNAGINLQLSAKVNEKKQPTVWGISGNAAYAKFKNGNIANVLSLNEISNLSLGIYNLRPLNDRWSLLATVGGGIYAPTSRPSEITLSNIIGSFGATFIRRFSPTFEFGGGLALNNGFGYPMLFPTLYLNWTTGDKISLKVSMMNGVEVSAGYHASDDINLAIVAEYNGQGAVVKTAGKDIVVTHQYAVAGFRPEFKIGKKLSIPITAGINAGRTLEYSDRSIKSIFSEGKGYNFNVSPYVAAGIVMNIN